MNATRRGFFGLLGAAAAVPALPALAETKAPEVEKPPKLKMRLRSERTVRFFYSDDDDGLIWHWQEIE